ncbi:MAG TPA: aromatic amino acid lyase, partial [Spirochaetia bacterium]|nr:aromatic amino acid lyase [Spirochaetia bacterium]
MNETGDGTITAQTVVLGAGPLTIENLVAVARGGARVQVAEAARQRMREARLLVDRWVREGKAVYGVTTGFGALCDVAIPREQTRAL